LNHLWQRFLLASSLLIGLAIGVAATVFGYSNLAAVDVHWSVFHINAVPLWTVAVVPIALVLIAGTLYHWVDGLHHFTEHMRHRRRVHELETEVASLRARLDQVLEMPDQAASALPAKKKGPAALPPPDDEMAALGSTERLEHTEQVPLSAATTSEAPKPNGDSADGIKRPKSRKRVTPPVTAAPAAPDSVPETEPIAPDPEA
jgi:hypothetical protein